MNIKYYNSWNSLDGVWRGKKLFVDVLIVLLCCVINLFSQVKEVFPGFLNQEVYEHYVEYYTNPHSPEYIEGSDPILVKTILRLETYGVPWQTSRSGALGCGQLLLSTARTMDPTVTKETLLFDIGYAIKLTCIHTVDLTRLIRSNFKNIKKHKTLHALLKEKELVLAAYNAGFGSVKKYRGVPPFPETRKYCKNGVTIFKQLLKQERKKLQ